MVLRLTLIVTRPQSAMDCLISTGEAFNPTFTVAGTARCREAAGGVKITCAETDPESSRRMTDSSVFVMETERILDR